MATIRTKYTKELLEPKVMDSISMAELISKLGLKLTGGNYSHIKKVLRKLNISTNHFLGMGHNLGKRSKNRKLPEEYLVYNNSLTFCKSDSIRKWLIRDGLKNNKCEICNNSKWMKKDIPLELHHIDHDKCNNTLDNLMVLCPNCHKLFG